MSGGHLSQDDVDRNRDVDLLDLALLQGRDRVGVHEPDPESGDDFFFDPFRLGFRFFESGRQDRVQRQKNLVTLPPLDDVLNQKNSNFRKSEKSFIE